MGMSTGGGDDVVKSEPNVVPMIDVMLVLLIIFMILTPVITAGFQATMPQAKYLDSRPEEDNDIVLGIDNDGQYFLDAGSGEIRPIPKDSLGPYLTRIYENRTRDRILYFRADITLKFEHIEDAMDVARKSGVAVLAAITDLKRDEEAN